MEKIKKKLPIGIESFEKMRMEDFYYIDKTGLIRELLQNWGEVNLFTRPRRFGKSLNMSMLRCFFEVGDKQRFFQGLEIEREPELCDEYMGKFPVISISLKGIEGEDFEAARAMMCSEIGNEALRFSDLMKSDVFSDSDREKYQQLTTIDTMGREMFAMTDAALTNSLKTLSLLLEKYYGKKVIILIDEYDVPLAKAFDRGYYRQMVNLIRGMFERALKTNEGLHFAVLTGCLRVSKESIFTGLNNPKILSISDVEFDEYFGFTDREVQELLAYYQLSESYDTVKEWYDGYQFGNVEVYCPWDVICYANKLRFQPNAQPEAYWINTSGNDIVRRFIEKADTGTTKREIERLVAGEAIRKEIHQEMVYPELYTTIENIWSVLFMTGYLTKQGDPEGDEYQLVIPNQEIRKIFARQIMQYFKTTVQKDGETLQAFCEALKNGEAEEVERRFSGYLKKTISIRDTFVRKSKKENFYHGILLGILGFKEGWGISSNKESGDGYSDILVEIDEEEIGIVLEVKYPDTDDLEAGCREALLQIEKNHYADQLREYGMETILKYGIACYQKRCRVMVEREDHM